MSSFAPTNNVFSSKSHQLVIWKSLIEQSRIVLIWAPHKPFDKKKNMVKKNEVFKWKSKKLFLSSSHELWRKRIITLKSFTSLCLPSEKELHTTKKIKWIGSHIPCTIIKPINFLFLSHYNPKHGKKKFAPITWTSWSLLGPGVEVGLTPSFIDYGRLSLK